MAEHEGYSYRYLAKCQCTNWPRIRFQLGGESAYAVSYEAEQVTYKCAECEDVVGVFYRVPALERERAKADKSLIGEVIQAERFVAWVGYAKNPSTVVIPDSELAREALHLCKDAVNQANFGRLAPIAGPDPPMFTLEQAEAMLQEANWRVRRGFEQWARYRLRGEAYRTDPLRDRGLWFQDIPVEGEVVAIVACVTGKQVPSYGLSGGQWDWDEGEPAYLDGAVHHVLYGVVTIDGWRSLVHPTDVEVHCEDS